MIATEAQRRKEEPKKISSICLISLISVSIKKETPQSNCGVSILFLQNRLTSFSVLQPLFYQYQQGWPLHEYHTQS